APEMIRELDLSRLYVEPGRRQEFAQLLQGRDTVTDLESQVYRKNGEIIWITENFRALRDQSGTLTGFVGTLQDITASKRAEQLQAALYHIAEITSSVSDLQQFYCAIHQVVGELMYAKNFYIALCDDAAR